MKATKSKTVMMVCLTAFAVNAFGQQVDPSEVGATDDETHTHEHSARAGQTVFIDPKTGEIVPGQGQVVPEKDTTDIDESTKSRSVSVLGSGVASAPQLLKDGSMKIELNGQFIVPISVSIDQDGNMQKGHHIQVENESDKETN